MWGSVENDARRRKGEKGQSMVSEITVACPSFHRQVGLATEVPVGLSALFGLFYALLVLPWLLLREVLKN